MANWVDTVDARKTVGDYSHNDLTSEDDWLFSAACCIMSWTELPMSASEMDRTVVATRVARFKSVIWLGVEVSTSNDVIPTNVRNGCFAIYSLALAHCETLSRRVSSLEWSLLLRRRARG